MRPPMGRHPCPIASPRSLNNRLYLCLRSGVSPKACCLRSTLWVSDIGRFAPMALPVMMQDATDCPFIHVICLNWLACSFPSFQEA